MSAAQLAEALGLSPANLSYRMRGKTSFTYDELTAIARVLGVEPAVWFDEPENALQHLRAVEPPEDDVRSRSSSPAAPLAVAV